MARSIEAVKEVQLAENLGKASLGALYGHVPGRSEQRHLIVGTQRDSAATGPNPASTRILPFCMFQSLAVQLEYVALAAPIGDEGQYTRAAICQDA